MRRLHELARHRLALVAAATSSMIVLVLAAAILVGPADMGLRDLWTMVTNRAAWLFGRGAVGPARVTRRMRCRHCSSCSIAVLCALAVPIFGSGPKLETVQ